MEITLLLLLELDFILLLLLELDFILLLHQEQAMFHKEEAVVLHREAQPHRVEERQSQITNHSSKPHRKVRLSSLIKSQRTNE
jgi:hypothetical protein